MRRGLSAVAIVLSLAVLGVGVFAFQRSRRAPGPASGELIFRGHTGSFRLSPTYCRRAVSGKGAGVYNQATPALAFGYFDDPDGGRWVEAQGPGVVGATRFDPEDCTVFDVKVDVDGGRVSGHVEVVCDEIKSPGVIHVEGETTFSGCSDAAPR